MKTVELFTDNKNVKGNILDVCKTLNGNIIIKYSILGMDDDFYYASIINNNGIWEEENIDIDINKYKVIKDDYFKEVFIKYQMGDKVKLNKIPEIHINLNSSSNIETVLDENVYVMFNGDEIVAFNFFEKQYGYFSFLRKALSNVDKIIIKSVIDSLDIDRFAIYKNVRKRIDSNVVIKYEKNGNVYKSFANYNIISYNVLCVKVDNMELLEACKGLDDGYPLNIIPGELKIHSKVYDREIFGEDEIEEPIRAFIIGLSGNLDIQVGDYKYNVERY